MILVSEDWNAIGASVNQILTGALFSSPYRLPQGCRDGASGTPTFPPLALFSVSHQSLLPTLSPREEQVLRGICLEEGTFPAKVLCLPEGRTRSCTAEPHFPGGGILVRTRLSTLSVTQPSGRDCCSAILGHPEPHSTV